MVRAVMNTIILSKRDFFKALRYESILEKANFLGATSRDHRNWFES